ncbi:RNA polymerase sigma factor [Alistipes sp.]|uniref:RNA polymerase sigma factor n=1 Tax=Alistipes sp. TaxID=1872444 RepID=UPI003A8617EB
MVAETDTGLLLRFNKREPEAFGRVYARLYDGLHLYGRMLFGKTDLDVKDVLQDIFLALWLSDTRFDDMVKLKGYLVIAMKNRYRSHMRHLVHEMRYDREISLEPGIGIEPGHLRMRGHLLELLNLLPEECARVMGYYIDGYRPEEIARVLHKNIQTIYNTKQRAISLLKQKILLKKGDL